MFIKLFRTHIKCAIDPLNDGFDVTFWKIPTYLYLATPTYLPAVQLHYCVDSSAVVHAPNCQAGQIRNGRIAISSSNFDPFIFSICFTNPKGDL